MCTIYYIYVIKRGIYIYNNNNNNNNNTQNWLKSLDE